MKVTIHGPNLNDQSKGQFHVHAASCVDNNHYGPGRRFGGESGAHDWTIDASSRVEVGDDIYSDHIGEGSMESGEGAEDCWFAPCCADLPQGTPEGETGPQALKRVVSEAVADGAEVAVNIDPVPSFSVVRQGDRWAVRDDNTRTLVRRDDGETVTYATPAMAEEAIATGGRFADPDTLRPLIDRLGIVAEVAVASPREGWPADARHFTVSLVWAKTYRIHVPYSQGSAHTAEPTAHDVLSSLALDFQSVAPYTDWIDWADDLGMFQDGSQSARSVRGSWREIQGFKTMFSSALSAEDFAVLENYQEV